MLAFLNANKTKILGVLLIVTTFIQSDAGLVDLIGPVQFAWTVRLAGVLTLIFGFLNNPPISSSREGQ